MIWRIAQQVNYHDKWVISVVFSAEPNAIYNYHYKDGIITQGDLSGSAENDIYKHVEGTDGVLYKGKQRYFIHLFLFSCKLVKGFCTNLFS